MKKKRLKDKRNSGQIPQNRGIRKGEGMLKRKDRNSNSDTSKRTERVFAKIIDCQAARTGASMT